MTDRRPWFCLDCSDRFATDRKGKGHDTEYRPRDEETDGRA